MREIIENKARPIIDKPSKLDVLKKVLLSVKRLPLGVITTAEKICQCAKDELKNHLKYYGTKQNVQYFQEYVKDHFDAIVVFLQLQASTSTFTGESASIPATPVIAPSDSVAFLHRDLSGMDMASDMSSVSGAPSRAAMSSISHNPSDISMVEAPPENVGYRTCTVSFKSLLRKGVSSDLVESFLQKLNTALHNVSDYVTDLQLVVYALMLSMKYSQFVAPGYNIKTDVTTSALPLPSNALKSTDFCNGVKGLLQSRHIDYLHTALFGQRGTKISHPTFAALSSANAPILGAIVRDTPQPANELMMVTRGLYKTNLENMWASNKVFNKSLNKLLEILLRVHLAPKRESHYWELQQTKAKKQPKQVVKSIRNSFHNAIRSEKYKLQKYQRKAQDKPEDNNWAKRARNSQERITHMYADAKRPVKAVSTSGTTFDQAVVSASGSGSFTTAVSTPTDPSSTSDAVAASNASFDIDSADMPIDELLPLSELIDEEDDQEEEEDTRDLPRRRIMILKTTLRNLLVRQAGKSITHTQLKKERPISRKKRIACACFWETYVEPLPESYRMRAEDIDFGSGQSMRRKITLKDKKTTEEGKRVQEIEQQLPRSSVFRAKEVEGVMSNLDAHRSNGQALRTFYHSKKQNTLSNKTEHIDRRFRSRFASRKRSFCAGVRPQTSLVMFIGDRGLCVGSRLKGHLKYGGKWKPRLHSSVATVHTTNEHKTSQTCMYCFGPTSHPTQTIRAKDGKTKARSIHGAFLCLNSACVSVLNHRAIQGRDRTSALAIAVFGLSSLPYSGSHCRYSTQNPANPTLALSPRPPLSATETRYGTAAVLH